MDNNSYKKILDERFINLNKIKEYWDFDSQNKVSSPIELDLRRLLNYTLDRSDSFSESTRFWSTNGFVPGIMTLLFQVEVFYRLNLLLLEGEYLHLLQKDDQSKDYFYWLKEYTGNTQLVYDPKIFPTEGAPEFELKFQNELQHTYFNSNRIGEFVESIIGDNLGEFLASIEKHYHFTQVENFAMTFGKSGYLKTFQENEYPLYKLFGLLYLNLKIIHEDHFISADHKCLTNLVNCRYELLKLMYVENSDENIKDVLSTENHVLPIKYSVRPIFKNDQDTLRIFSQEAHAENFYNKLNEIISEKFKPVVQALYEKTNFLIRKLLILHGYRDIKDPQMRLLDDKHIPLVFLSRGIVNFKYEDYQLSYHLFKWEQRAKYNYADTQTFVELDGYKIGKYRTQLYKEENNCKASLLKSFDTYHYCTRYFRDFEPSPEHLSRLYISFREHIYNKARDFREEESKKRNAIGFKIFRDESADNSYQRNANWYDRADTPETEKLNEIDPLNEHNWFSTRQMCNYLYYSCLSLKLSGNYGVAAKVEDAKEWMTEVRLMQEETGIYSYFPYYRYAQFLLRQIKYLVTEDGKSKELSELFIQLRETITTCENYFVLCNRNGFTPFNMPITECYPYYPYEENLSPSETYRFPKKTEYYYDNGKWTLATKEPVHLFVASSHSLPDNFESRSRRIAELKAEVENVAISQVTQLNEKIRNEAKTLKEDLFKTFGWFTGIVSFVVGGIFKLSGSANQSLYGTLLFMACFGICLMIFIFALFGLTKEKSSLWNRLFTFLESKAEFTVDGGRETTLTRISYNFFRTTAFYVASFFSSAYAFMIHCFNPYQKPKSEFEKKFEYKLGHIRKVYEDVMNGNNVKSGTTLFFHWIMGAILAIILFPLGLVAYIIRVLYVFFKYSILLLVRLFKYISAGGSLWRAMFFLGIFVGLALFFQDNIKKEDLVRNYYKDSLVKNVVGIARKDLDSTINARIQASDSSIKKSLLPK